MELANAGHDVLSAADGFADASDEFLLALAHRQRRILVTRDKDFGTLVFIRRLPRPCIVRLAGLAVVEEVEAMRDLIEHHGNAMREGAIIVVTGKRVRIRSAETVRP